MCSFKLRSFQTSCARYVPCIPCVFRPRAEPKEFTIGLDPQMKGLAIGNSEPIRKAQILPATTSTTFTNFKR